MKSPKRIWLWVAILLLALAPMTKSQEEGEEDPGDGDYAEEEQEEEPEEAGEEGEDEEGEGEEGEGEEGQEGGIPPEGEEGHEEQYEEDPHGEMEDEAVEEAEAGPEPEEEAAMEQAGAHSMMDASNPMAMIEDPNIDAETDPAQKLESEEEAITKMDQDQNEYPAGDISQEELEHVNDTNLPVENIAEEEDFEGQDTGSGDEHAMISLDVHTELQVMRNFKKISDDCKRYEQHFRDCLDDIPPEAYTQEEVEKCVGKDFTRIINYLSMYFMYN